MLSVVSHCVPPRRSSDRVTPGTERVDEIVAERIGVRWRAVYGASEVPVIAGNPVGRPEEWRLDSAGLPADRVSLRVVALESGAEFAPGEIGEIQVQGPSVMAGYLPDEANADAFHDGWYRTGDRTSTRLNSSH